MMVRKTFYEVLKSSKYNTFDSIEKLFFFLEENGPKYKLVFLDKNKSIPSKCIEEDEYILKVSSNSREIEIKDKDRKKHILERLVYNHRDF